MEIGQKTTAQELVTSVTDADGNSLKEVVRYYAQDGTKITGDYKIEPMEVGTLVFHFLAEDEEGIQTKETFTLQVIPPPLVPGAQKLLDTFEIGTSVTANLYENDSNSLCLGLEGIGETFSYTSASHLPWDSYRSRIEECYISETVLVPDMSYWFYGCSRLLHVPEVRGVKKMDSAFEDCARLKTAWFPEGVVSTRSAYKNCISLVSSGVVPNSVQDVTETFYGCKKLKGDLTILASPISYRGCFYRAGSQKDGIWLIVHSSEANKSVVSAIVLDELMNGNPYIKFV